MTARVQAMPSSPEAPHKEQCWLGASGQRLESCASSTCIAVPAGRPARVDWPRALHPGKMATPPAETGIPVWKRLRQELPNLLLHSHDYTLYPSDVEFITEILNIRTKGRTLYILSLTLCRFLAWNYFAQLQLEVLQLTRHSENWTLQARWRLVGLPIHMLFLRFYKRDKDELYRTYDAYSTFYLNSNGLICRHRLDKLMPSHSPPTPVKKLLVGALVALGLSEPKPNLHLFSKA
ncbi:uncharacterized protein C6orf136 homolog [Choloepus didactylus]|uniref:uncharacterized protein C6orf136 homolog n=1 Tax=Choloepus didactylus TaxID=27675 RepID=UPI00189FFDD6|nr:uncharacterized protein C6orf136 homolog [Choloepus didactylus]